MRTPGSRSISTAGAGWPSIRRRAARRGRPGHVRPGSGPAARTPAFYGGALGLLARGGLAPGVAEPARQFASRVGERAPDRAVAFDRLTGYYERARFGAAPLSEAERQDVMRSLVALNARS